MMVTETSSSLNAAKVTSDAFSNFLGAIMSREVSRQGKTFSRPTRSPQEQQQTFSQRYLHGHCCGYVDITAEYR